MHKFIQIYSIYSYCNLDMCFVFVDMHRAYILHLICKIDKQKRTKNRKEQKSRAKRILFELSSRAPREQIVYIRQQYSKRQSDKWQSQSAHWCIQK